MRKSFQSQLKSSYKQRASLDVHVNETNTIRENGYTVYVWPDFKLYYPITTCNNITCQIICV